MLIGVLHNTALEEFYANFACLNDPLKHRDDDHHEDNEEKSH